MTTFRLENPEFDFKVIDGGFSGTFDGQGDEVFEIFNTIVLGDLGEAGEFVEFDINGFSLPAGEHITHSTFQFSITSLEVGGLGIGFGENPDTLGIYGYTGNGIAETSDFEAGYLLGTIDISSAEVGDIITFNITEFVQDLVNQGESWVGLGVRAQDFGGLAIEESSIFPKLKITTEESLNITGTFRKDSLTGAGANDSLRGRSGNDVLVGLAGDDLLQGNADSDTLVGGADFDTLFGDNGNDLLDGGDSLDTLSGGKGNDVLQGGSSDNLLTGGRDSDKFVLQSGGTQTITDFQNGQDLLLLKDGLSFEQLTIAKTSTVTGSGAGIYLTESFEFLAFLQGVSTDLIGAEDFID